MDAIECIHKRLFASESDDTSSMVEVARNTTPSLLPYAFAICLTTLVAIAAFYLVVFIQRAPDRDDNTKVSFENKRKWFQPKVFRISDTDLPKTDSVPPWMGAATVGYIFLLHAFAHAASPLACNSEDGAVCTRNCPIRGRHLDKCAWDKSHG